MQPFAGEKGMEYIASFKIPFFLTSALISPG